jgi:hypothetical protein
MIIVKIDKHQKEEKEMQKKIIQLIAASSFSAGLLMTTENAMGCSPASNKSRLICSHIAEGDYNYCIRTAGQIMDEPPTVDNYQQKQYARALYNGGCEMTYQQTMAGCKKCPKK